MGYQPGAMVGRYRLLQLVGRGGMGEVYAAHDPELDRKIAIKIMRADAVPDDVEAARLMREAQTIARLSHPNLVTVYDVGTADGRVFVAMELIEGDTVAAWLDQQAPTARRDPPRVRPGRPRAWPPRTAPGSSTATSNRRTSWSRPTARARDGLRPRRAPPDAARAERARA